MYNKFKFNLYKIQWGIRTVGLLQAFVGFLRYAYIRIKQPDTMVIELASGGVLEFSYPNQLPVIPVIFGDLIDPEFAFLKKVSKPSWTVIDVGAAIGQFSVFASNLPCSNVHAFEPCKDNLITLNSNIILNSAEDKIHIHKIALSNYEGEACFETGKSNFESHIKNEETESEDKVQVKTLSNELKRLNIEDVSVLKINVAGFEPEVIEGSMTYLSEGKVDIIILLLGIRSFEWYKKLYDIGYRFFYYDPKKELLHEVTSFDKSSVLDYRPWPARHIISIHHKSLEYGILEGSTISIEKIL